MKSMYGALCMHVTLTPLAGFAGERQHKEWALELAPSISVPQQTNAITNTAPLCLLSTTMQLQSFMISPGSRVLFMRRRRVSFQLKPKPINALEL